MEGVHASERKGQIYIFFIDSVFLPSMPQLSLGMSGLGVETHTQAERQEEEPGLLQVG